MSTATFPVIPGINAGFIPDHEATARLNISISRNPLAFPYARYAKITPILKTAGYYRRRDPKVGARIVNTTEYDWADGDPAPVGKATAQDWVLVQTKRRAYPFALGQLTVEQATSDLVAEHAQDMAMLAATRRTIALRDALTTAANWKGNTSSATTAGGGVWLASSAANAYIQKSINYVVNAIQKTSVGVVQASDLVMVVDPTGARTIAESPEYKQFLVNNPQSYQFLQGVDLNMFNQYGLTPFVFGVRTVIEDTVRITSNEGQATTTYANMLSALSTVNAVAVFLTRTQGIEANAAIGDFSTCHLMVKEDMTVETFPDAKNRRVEGRVVDDIKPEIVCPESGWYLTNIDS